MLKYICGECMKKYFIVFLLIVGLLAFVPQVDAKKQTSTTTGGNSYSNVNVDISNEKMDCDGILRGNGEALVKLGIAVVRIAAVIICIIQMMFAFIPAITRDDPKALNKAFRKSIMLSIIMLCAFLLPTFIRIMGMIFAFDTSCFT